MITDADIQAYIRSGVGRGRESERIGPFLATFTGHSDNPYLNYAIPDDGATPSPADVAALVVAYRRHERLPRLEYMASLSPAVEAALADAGFTVEGRLPIMVCTPDSARDLPVPAGIALIAPASDDIGAMIAAQNEAYGEGPPGPEEVAARRDHLAAGGLAILARDATTGEPAGGATCDVPLHGVTELAGVGVRPAFRRRGIAAAMTARLVGNALARGVTTIFLTPAGEEEERIYARAGFLRTSEQVHISLRREAMSD